MGGEFDLALIRDFATALFLGALVGIEREKRRSSADDPGIGGIRTFVLLAEAGAVSAWLAGRLGATWIFSATLIAVAAIIVASYWIEARVAGRAPGLTTEFAALAVFLLGGATMFGYPAVAVALAIATSALLAFKQPIHGLVARVGNDDLLAGLKLLIASFVVLPLLPDRIVDPWGAINPRSLWLLVILIAGLSLVGYVLVRWLGAARGTALAGISGGLVSSTAVTLSFARRSRDTGTDVPSPDALAAGIVLAWGVMFARIVVEVAVVYPALLGRVIVPMAGLGVACAVVALVFLRRGGGGGVEELPVTNPFRLWPAIQFALLFAAVLLVVKLAGRYLPQTGVYLVAALAGLSDVDAITLSMAGYARDGGDAPTAVAAIAVAALANTSTKVALVAALGSRRLRQRALVAAAAILGVGAVALYLA